MLTSAPKARVSFACQSVSKFRGRSVMTSWWLSAAQDRCPCWQPYSSSSFHATCVPVGALHPTDHGVASDASAA